MENTMCIFIHFKLKLKIWIYIYACICNVHIFFLFAKALSGSEIISRNNSKKHFNNSVDICEYVKFRRVIKDPKCSVMYIRAVLHYRSAAFVIRSEMNSIYSVCDGSRRRVSEFHHRSCSQWRCSPRLLSLMREKKSPNGDPGNKRNFAIAGIYIAGELASIKKKIQLQLR